MLTYIARRLLLMIPTTLGIVVLSFLVMKMAPGDPTAIKFSASAQSGGGMEARRGMEQAMERFRERYHLDEALYIQFGYFVKRLATGDLVFLVQERPVWPELWPAMRITLILNGVVFFLTYLIAIPLGIASAAFPHSTWDRVTTLLLFMLYSLPSFWAAELLRTWFLDSDQWIWFPVMGIRGEDFDQLSLWGKFLDYVHHFVLPVTCLTYGSLAYLSRQMRAGMFEVIRQDYIRTAKAKGAGKARVILIHALRNGLFPIITLFATLLPFLIGGSVIIETIFNIPGMGRFAFNNVLMREYDAALAVLIMSAVLTLFGILISDLLYVIVNPQVSLEGRR